MKIGYLHVGVPLQQESGVTRFGRLLAGGVSQIDGIEVHEVSVLFGEDEAENLTQLNTAAQQMQDCDLVHLQYNKHTWGVGWKQLKRLQAFQKACPCPLVITLHDVYYGSYPADHPLKYLWRENKRQRSFSGFKSLSLRSTYRVFQDEFRANRQTMQWILSRSSQVIACTKTEAQRIKHYPAAERIQAIPLYVEPRSPQFTHEAAKAHLGLEDDIVIVIQGFIYEGKGHPLMVAALPHLPKSVKVIFAGGVAPQQERYMENLKRFMDDLKVSDRITITGYLSDDDLNTYLMAADLALCPFQGMAASASLATWIALDRPILASKLPQIEELNTLVPGAIQTFESLTPEGLALTLLKWLLESPDPSEQQRCIAELRERLSLLRIAQDHSQIYQRIAGKRVAPTIQSYARVSA